MGILKDLLNEMSQMPGIYDIKDNLIKRIIGGDIIDNKGNKNIDNNYITKTMLSNRIKNSFKDDRLNIKFINYVLEHNKTNINPQSGYQITINHKKIILYSLKKFINIIAEHKDNGELRLEQCGNGEFKYRLNSDYIDFFNQNELSKKKKSKEEIEYEKWLRNQEYMARINPSERYSDDDDDDI